MRRLMIGVLGSMLVAPCSAASSTTIIGRVVDENGAPIRNAQVRAHDDHVGAIAPVTVTGTFEIVLAANSTVVTVDITAEGFEKRIRNLVVVNARADAGTLTMTRAKGLSAATFTISRSGDATIHYVDAFVQNDAPKAVDVVSVRVQGMRKKHTGCLDWRPGVQFTIHEQFWAGHVAAAVSDVANAPDSVSAEGHFLELGCGQQQIDVLVPYSFSLKPGERIKLRVAIPSALRTDNHSPPIALALEQFVVVSMTLHVTAGADVTLSRELPGVGKEP